MRARRGYSLIEAVTAIGLITATLAAVTAALFAMRKADRHVRDEAAFETELGRFAAQFRADAHLARSAKIEEPAAAGASPIVLSLVLPGDRKAQYTLKPDEIDREVRRGETVLHRETYRLPGGPSRQWVLRTDGRLPMVSLVVAPESAGAEWGAARGLCRVDAAVRLIDPQAKPATP